MTITKVYKSLLKEVHYIPQEDDPEIIDDENATKLWWHREDGPAYICAVEQFYWYDNLPHRYDGPSAESRVNNEALSSFYRDWNIHGNKIDEHEYKDWLIEMGIDIENLSTEDKLLIDLKWSRAGHS